MTQRYEKYNISNDNIDLESGIVIEDLKVNWDVISKDWKNRYDEEGVLFYFFKEEENRIELTCVDPEGNGSKSILTKFI